MATAKRALRKKPSREDPWTPRGDLASLRKATAADCLIESHRESCREKMMLGFVERWQRDLSKVPSWKRPIERATIVVAEREIGKLVVARLIERSTMASLGSLLLIL